MVLKPYIKICKYDVQCTPINNVINFDMWPAWSNRKKLHIYNYHTIYRVMHCVPKKFRKTPSNASNFPKGFRRSHFWTSMMSYSWNFFDSCANSNRKITKLIYVLICKKEEQNGHTKNGVKKSDFLDRKKSDMWIHNVSCICIFWVYQIKQKYAI